MEWEGGKCSSNYENSFEFTKSLKGSWGIQECTDHTLLRARTDIQKKKIHGYIFWQC